jgi:hypothetical protein
MAILFRSEYRQANFCTKPTYGFIKLKKKSTNKVLFSFDHFCFDTFALHALGWEPR